MKLDPVITLPAKGAERKTFLAYFSHGKDPFVIYFYAGAYFHARICNKVNMEECIGWLPLPLIDVPVWYENITDKVRCFAWSGDKNDVVIDRIYNHVAGHEFKFKGCSGNYMHAIPATLKNAKEFFK